MKDTQRHRTRRGRQRSEVDNLQPTRPETRNGCPCAVRLDRDADGVRPDRQARADGQPAPVEEQRNELVTLIIKDQYMPPVRKRRQASEASSDYELFANASLSQIHQRDTAGA